MQIFKFGGASVKNAAAIRNVAEILKHYKNEKLVIVVSAMGKSTNALEAITNAYFYEKEERSDLFQNFKDFHYNIIIELFGEKKQDVTADVDAVFANIEQYFEKKTQASYNFIYDQIVSSGELLSTILVSAYLNAQNLPTQWLDVRTCVKTDNVYREANIDWDLTRQKINDIVPKLVESNFIVTQGFLGATPEFFTTTLGREGSDFTAAIFANALNAEKMTVWKDVVGILNADPRLVPDAIKISHLTYYEAIEMTYYGAKVIHPKTIKPIQNKNIPLIVRSFAKPHENGTIIHTHSLPESEKPPVIVFNKNQILLSIITKDFSFIAENNLSQIYQLFAKHRIKANLSQNAAISFSACIDNVPYKVEPLIADLNVTYKVLSNKDLELITIRNYRGEVIEKHTQNRDIILQQKSRQTIQMLVK
jgi:aspartate kinase